MKTTIYLMRHGECVDNHILRGQIDAQISEHGLASMHQAVMDNELFVDVIYSSPLSRCLRFAEQLSEQQKLPLNVETGLAEMNFGLWDGKRFDQLYQQDSENLELFWANPWQNMHLPPQGESIIAFENRVLACLQRCLHQAKGKQLLMVTHGGVIRCLMAWALGVEQAPGFYRQLLIPYAGIVKLTVLHDEAGVIHPQLHWK